MSQLHLVALAAVICLQASVLCHSLDAAEDVARRMSRMNCTQDSDCEAITNSVCGQLTQYCQTSACVCPVGFSYVDGVSVCAPAISSIGQHCSKYRGCKTPYSRCTNEACQCQEGYRPFGSQCIRRMQLNMEDPANGMRSINIVNGGVSISSSASGQQTSGLRQTCSEGSPCRDPGAVCLQCDPQNPRMVCSLLQPVENTTTSTTTTTQSTTNATTTTTMTTTNATTITTTPVLIDGSPTTSFGLAILSFGLAVAGLL